MTKTVSALFDSYAQASTAVASLERAGVPHSDISIVANNSDNWHKGPNHTTTGDAATGAGSGASIGAAVGGVGGLLAGLGMLAIPGLGPVVAAGWLASTALGAVGGAVVGSAAGGLVNGLTDAGVPETDAHVYAEGVRRGGTLVTAKVSDSLATQADGILHAQRPVDLAKRGSDYRSSGWQKFDPAAPAYDADQVARERSRYMGGGI